MRLGAASPPGTRLAWSVAAASTTTGATCRCRPPARFDRKSEQYLCAALLRHGKAVASDGTVGLLSRLLPLVRGAFPRARILVRLDGSSRCGATAPHAPPEAARSRSLMVQVSTPSGIFPRKTVIVPTPGVAEHRGRDVPIAVLAQRLRHLDELAEEDAEVDSPEEVQVGIGAQHSHPSARRLQREHPPGWHSPPRNR